MKKYLFLIIILLAGCDPEINHTKNSDFSIYDPGFEHERLLATRNDYNLRIYELNIDGKKYIFIMGAHGNSICPK